MRQDDRPAAVSQQWVLGQRRLAEGGFPERRLPERSLPEGGFAERGLPEGGLPEWSLAERSLAEGGLPERCLPERCRRGRGRARVLRNCCHRHVREIRRHDSGRGCRRCCGHREVADLSPCPAPATA